MAVGGEGVRIFSEGYEKRLQVGQSVQYWSTSKGKWMDCVVKAVDANGAVQISVKARAWISQEEQSSKIRSIGVLPARSAEQPSDSKPAAVISESSQRPENGKHTNGASTHAITNGAKKSVSIAADVANRSDRSKALYSVFSEWDAQQQGPPRSGGPLPPRSGGPVPSRSGGPVAPRSGGPVAPRSGGPVMPGRIPPASLGQELKIFKDREKDIRQYKQFLLQQPQRCVQMGVTKALWTAFYPNIREKCAALRAQPERRRAKSQADSAAGPSPTRTDMEAAFTVALKEAKTCLQHICAEVKEKASSASTSEEDAERLQAHREILGHLYIMLADLERYRATSGTSDSEAAMVRAEELYRASLSWCPELGQAYNQRGLVAAQQGNKLKAVRCGFHSMLCAITFPKSEQNLLVWLGQIAEDVATPEKSPNERVRGTPVLANHARAAQGAVCRLQLTLLQLREGEPGDGASRQNAIVDLISQAQGQMKEAAASVEVDMPSQGPGLAWILETLMISLCAAAYHRRCQPQANGKPTVLDKLMDVHTSTAFWAWDWVVRFGLCLAEETKQGAGHQEAEPSPFLAPLSLLCLLATVLLPHSWRSSVTAPLQEVLQGHLKVASEEHPGDQELLSFRLPEDEVAAGLLPFPELDTTEGARAAEGEGSADVSEASEDEVVLQTPVVKVASPEKKVLSPLLDASNGDSQVGSRKQAPSHLHAQVRRARLSYCLRIAAEGAAEAQPEAPPPRAPEAPAPLPAAAGDDFSVQVPSWTGEWGQGGWDQGYEDPSWRAWGNDEWGDGWADAQMDEGQTLEELGEEPDLWDMPDMNVAPEPTWYGGYNGYAAQDPPPSVPPGYGSSVGWLATSSEAWYGMATTASALPPATPGFGLGPPPGLGAPLAEPARAEADICHLPMVDLGFLDEDLDADPRPSAFGLSALGASRRPPPPSCLPPPPPRGH